MRTPFPGLAESAEALAEASDKAAEKGGKLGKAAAAAAGGARDALAKNPPDTAKKSLQRRSSPCIACSTITNGPAADLTRCCRRSSELQLQLAGLARANQPEQAAFDMAKSRMGGQRDALSNLRNASARLPRPLGGWFSVLAERRLAAGPRRCLPVPQPALPERAVRFLQQGDQQALPVQRTSASDVAVSDFREFFKAQGVAERFFETYMRPLRPAATRAVTACAAWTVTACRCPGLSRPDGHGPGDPPDFFAENPAEPQVRFRLEPYTLDPGVSRAEVPFRRSVHGVTATARSYRCRSSGQRRRRRPAPAWCWRRWPDDRWKSNAIPGPWSLFPGVRPDAEPSTSAGVT
ncbi:hypothetical protein ACPA9J_07940 [Pseudomonas aeruginosa]